MELAFFGKITQVHLPTLLAKYIFPHTDSLPYLAGSGCVCTCVYIAFFGKI
jgi:hypothetical protein